MIDYSGLETPEEGLLLLLLQRTARGGGMMRRKWEQRRAYKCAAVQRDASLREEAQGKDLEANKALKSPAL